MTRRLQPLHAMRWLLAAAAMTAALPAWAQYDHYPATADRYPPADSHSPPPADQRYGPPYGHAPDGRPWEASPSPYPATESLGPYDDYRQRHEFRPDFRQQPSAPPKPELLEESKVIAIVGNHYILAGDLLGDINQMLKPYEGQASPEELDRQRELMLQRMLPQAVQTKILYQETLSSVPAEALPQIEKKLAEEFDSKQLPQLIERAKVKSAAELDAKLREFGTSIEKQRRQFNEQVLAREVIRTKVEGEPDVSHQEMLKYYRSNIENYERQARVRWEELAVRFSETPNKREAYRAIAEMGNRVLRNAAFSRVARENSQGYTASDGGWHDWTYKGSLRSAVLDEALFTLPIGELSQIIETGEGFHIVRVLDREEAGRRPFFQEQARIKQLIQKEKREKEVEQFIAGLQARTRVWTIFDEPPAE